MYTIIKAQIYQTGKRIKEIVTEHETGYFKRKKNPSGIIINDWLTIQVSICTYLSPHLYKSVYLSPHLYESLYLSPHLLSKSPSVHIYLNPHLYISV